MPEPIKAGQIRVMFSALRNDPEIYIVLWHDTENVCVFYFSDGSRETFKNHPDWHDDLVLDSP